MGYKIFVSVGIFIKVLVKIARLGSSGSGTVNDNTHAYLFKLQDLFYLRQKPTGLKPSVVFG